MTVRFALLGTGIISHVHAEAIRKAGAELVCVYSRDEASGRAFAERHQCGWTTDLQEALGRRDVDAAAVCTPSGTHGDLAVAAAAHGKHVLVEKPIDISTAKADEAIRACRERGVTLGVIFQLRFMEETQKAKRLLDDGVIGRLLSVDTYLKFYRPPSYYQNSSWKGTLALDGGGALINQGVHGLDLLLWMAGDVRETSAQVLTLRHDIEAEDTVHAYVRFRSGAAGVIQAATSVWPDQPQRIEFHGERGTLVLAGTEVPYIRQLSVMDRPELDIRRDEPPEDELGEAHVRQYQDFIAAIAEGREPLVNGEEGRRSLQLVEAIYRSSAERRIVTLTD